MFHALPSTSGREECTGWLGCGSGIPGSSPPSEDLEQAAARGPQSTLKRMDKVRLGRALGKGTRAAASTLWEAAEAAAAPDPRPPVQPAPAASAAPPAEAAARPQQPAGRTAAVVTRARAVPAGTRRVQGAAAQAGRSMLAPVRRVSNVLWLEVTGTFFTLVALFMAQGVWKLRHAFFPGALPADAHKLWFHVGVFALFTYFALSSFLRARRRGRRP